MGFDKAYGTPFWTTRGAALGGIARRRGLGDTQCDETGCYDYYPSTGGGGTAYGPPADGQSWPSTNPPATQPFDWSSLINNLSTDFTKIYKAVQPTGTGCTQYTGPNGVSYTSCSGTQQAPAINIPGLTGSSTTTWLILAAVGIGIVALASGGKG